MLDFKKGKRMCVDGKNWNIIDLRTYSWICWLLAKRSFWFKRCAGSGTIEIHAIDKQTYFINFIS